MLLSPALARQTERAGDEVAVGHRRAVGRQLQGVAAVFDEAANHAQHIFLALMRAGKRIVAGLGASGCRPPSGWQRRSCRRSRGR